VKPIVDYTKQSLSQTNDKIRTDLQNYLKNEKINAVVEFVLSGNRVKLFVPDKRCYIPFALANVRCENFSFKEPSKSHPLGTQAYNLLKNKLFQRDVQIEVTELRFGNKDTQTTFLGHLHFDGRNVAEELIEQGLAKVVNPLPPKSKKGRKKQIYQSTTDLPPIPENFRILEDKARKAELGIHKQEEIKENEEENEEIRNKSSLIGKEYNVMVSHIETATIFWVNIVGNEAKHSLDEIEDKMSKIPTTKARRVRPHDEVAALYEGLYARGVVTSLLRFDDKDNKDNKDKDKNKNKNEKR